MTTPYLPPWLRPSEPPVSDEPVRPRRMPPEDIAFWDLILDNYSGEFLDAVSRVADEAIERREQDAVDDETEALFNDVRYE